jgi:hypothetical protein
LKAWALPPDGPSGLTDPTVGLSWSISVNLDTAMTLTLAWIATNGELLLASDGRACRGEKREMESAFRTIRVNGHCAFGFSGDAWAWGRFLCEFLGCPDWARTLNGPRIIDGWEKARYELEDTPYVRARDKTTTILAAQRSQLARGQQNPDVNVLLVGLQEGRPCLCKWRNCEGWAERETANWSDLEGLKFIAAAFCPPEVEPLEKEIGLILFSDSESLSHRVRRVFSMAASASPGKVNTNVVLRRSSTGFVAERLGSTPRSSQARH